MTLFDRTKEIIKKRGMSVSEVERKAGLSENYLYTWKKSDNPRKKSIESVAKVLGVSVDYLLGKNDGLPSNIKKVNKNDLVSIPVIGTIKAGINGIAFEEELGTEFTLVDDIDMTFDYFWLKVHGDSMTGDGISEGDYALIKKTTEFNKNDICAVIVDGEEGTLKHVTQNEDSIVLTASNPIYPPRVFTGTDMNKILIAGKLVQIKRNY
ncbi:S24 family peptidase [Pediococcus pentosaceus]|uniref:LexA family protein n=1 Tax=Pediococcus TaxID=1253 RepID=UPI002AFE4757|nr:S24 family peptidase [Pediococcus acidilactici]WQS11429.1 S24 family peptidase [Pediococcus acidilactici]